MKDRRRRPKKLVTVEGQECAWIPLTQRKRVLVDADLFDELNRHRWRYNTGYAVRQVRINGKAVLFLMHRIIAGVPVGLDTDHINRNRLDNRRTNLRYATTSENLRNRKMNRNNTAGLKGVYFLGADKKNPYQASIGYCGKLIYIGLFKTPQQAYAARQAEALKLHGEFATP